MATRKRQRGGAAPKPPPADAEAKPKWLLETKDLDLIAQRRCLMMLSVLSGEKSVEDASREADITPPLYYQLEKKALSAMLAALVPGATRDGSPAPATKQMEMRSGSRDDEASSRTPAFPDSDDGEAWADDAWEARAPSDAPSVGVARRLQALEAYEDDEGLRRLRGAVRVRPRRRDGAGRAASWERKLTSCDAPTDGEGHQEVHARARGPERAPGAVPAAPRGPRADHRFAKAARRLGMPRNHFQTIMHRGLEGMIEKLSPGKAGRPRSPRGRRSSRRSWSSCDARQPSSSRSSR